MDKNTEQQMEKRANDFLQAMKNAIKRMSPNPNIKHDVHLVDTQGFDTKAKIHVEDDES